MIAFIRSNLNRLRTLNAKRANVDLGQTWTDGLQQSLTRKKIANEVFRATSSSCSWP